MEYNFSTDSCNYEILTEAVKSIKGIPGIVGEIGINQGGGTKLIIDSLIENNDKDRIIIGIDSYGGMPCLGNDAGAIHRYDNSLKRNFLKNIYGFCADNNLDYWFFNMDDIEFFVRFNDGILIYKDGKREIINNYGLIHIDNEHTVITVKRQTEFFMKRMNVGSSLIYDDCPAYNHSEIHKLLLDNNFELFKEAGYKKAYKKK